MFNSFVGSFFSRTAYAIGGFRNAWNSFNIPSREFAYDSYVARLWRYNQALHYYANTSYDLVNVYAEVYKQQKNLYKHIRSIYNPVARLVDFYPGKVYGGTIDYEKLRTGAIPITIADDALRNAIRQVLRWSNWSTQKGLFVRNGALYGDTALKVVDDRDHGRVRMEVLDPRKIKYIERDDVGNIKRAIIEYMDYDESQPLTPNSTPQNKPYMYTETIDDESFKTYRDGQPYAYYEDADGHLVPEWENEYGFVPLVIAQHRNYGLEWGGSAYSNTTSKIDELNDAASLLNDQVRKAVQTIWWAAGVSKGTDLAASTDKRDEVPMVYAPEGSQPHAMVAPIDITAAIKNLEEMLAEIERDLPELSLHRLRDRGQLTAPGVRAGYSDAIDRVADARANYDDALVRALQMSVAMGGFNRYEEFRPYSLEQYQESALDFTIADRPVIDDQLSEMETVQFLIQTGAPSPAIWERMGYNDEQINKWKTTVTPQPGAVHQSMNGQMTITSEPPQPNSKLPTGQATDAAHLTDQRMADLFDQYHGLKAAING
jgi:Phage portal protein, SPP1 Gp6-like